MNEFIIFDLFSTHVYCFVTVNKMLQLKEIYPSVMKFIDRNIMIWSVRRKTSTIAFDGNQLLTFHLITFRLHF